MRVHPTGKVTVITGTSPHGQGHATSWSQIVESELGIPFDDVEVIHGDTAFAPYGLGTYGSRSAGGRRHGRVSRAPARCATRPRRSPRTCWRRRPTTSSSTTAPSASRAAPTSRMRIGEVAFRGVAGLRPARRRRARAWTRPCSTTRPTSPSRSAPTAAEVEVDKDTGKVEIARYIAVDDCGNVINPMIVDGQVHGGVAQSIGQALYEERRLRRRRPAADRRRWSTT